MSVLEAQLNEVLRPLARAEGEDVLGFLLKRGFTLTAEVRRVQAKGDALANAVRQARNLPDSVLKALEVYDAGTSLPGR